MSFQFSLYDALVSVDVPPDKARAVIDALESDMGATLATKSDVRLLQRDIDQLRKDVERDLELLRSSMTVRLGSIQVVTAGLLFAALKLT
jgi:ABC-type sulfate transport system substrate-binding protein